MTAYSRIPLPISVSWIFFALAAVLLPAGDVLAETCAEYSLVEDSKLAFLPLSDGNTTLTSQGSLAFIGGGFLGFKVVDLSDPTQPVLLTEFPLGIYRKGPTWVEPAGDVGFVGGAWGEIPVVDLSDPAAPSEITRIELPFEVRAMAHDRDFLYAATYGRRSFSGVDTSAFFIYNVSNPTAPVNLATVLETHDWAFSMEYHKGNIFLGASSGLHVLDVTDPGAVTELDWLDFPSAPRDMQFVGNRLYVSDWSGYLYVIDASDPSALDLMSVSDLKVGSGEGLGVSGGRAVIACRSSGLRVVDTADPYNPSVPAAWPTTVSCNEVLLTKGRVCVLRSDGLLVAKKEYPEPVEPIATLGLETYPKRQVLAGDYLFLLETKLRVLDVSDPAFPVEIGGYEDGTYYSRLSLDGTVLYLGALGGGVIALDVSDPAHPALLSTVTTDRIYSLHAAQGLLAVGPRSGVASLYDVSDPAKPLFLGEHDSADSYRAYGIAIIGDHLYMATSNLHVLDIGDPGNIHTVASLDTDFGHDLVADGEWIFTPGGDRDLTVARFTPPADLVSVAVLELPEYVEDMHLRDGTLSVACKKGGVHVFDVSDPANPLRIGAVTANEDARCVTGGGDFLVIGSSTYPAANDGNLEFYPLPCDRAPEVSPRLEMLPARIDLDAYPNPFNPRTEIVFRLSEAAPVQLGVFDLRGHLVSTLYRGVLPVGEHRFHWEGLDDEGRTCSSGVYFARVASADREGTRKLLLFK